MCGAGPDMEYRLSVFRIKIQSQNRNKRIHIEKVELKLILFIDDMITCVENLLYLQKVIRMNEFRQSYRKQDQ